MLTIQHLRDELKQFQFGGPVYVSTYNVSAPWLLHSIGRKYLYLHDKNKTGVVRIVPGAVQEIIIGVLVADNGWTTEIRHSKDDQSSLYLTRRL